MATGLIKKGQGFSAEGFSAEGFNPDPSVQPFDPSQNEYFLDSMFRLGQARDKLGPPSFGPYDQFPPTPDVFKPMELMYQNLHRTKGGEAELVDFSTSQDPLTVRTRERWAEEQKDPRTSGGIAWSKEFGSAEDIPIVRVNTYHEADSVNIFRHEGPGHIVLGALSQMNELKNIPFAEEMTGFLKDSIRAMEMAGYPKDMIKSSLGDNVEFKDGQWWSKGNLTVRDFYDLMNMDEQSRKVLRGESGPLAHAHGMISAMARDPSLLQNILGGPSRYDTAGGVDIYTGEKLPTYSYIDEEGNKKDMKYQTLTAGARREADIGELEVPVSYLSEDQAALGEGKYDPITYALLRGGYADKAIEKINEHIQKNIFGREGWLEELTWYEDNVAARARGE